MKSLVAASTPDVEPAESRLHIGRQPGRYGDTGGAEVGESQTLASSRAWL
jgi:hypothetical protein